MNSYSFGSRNNSNLARCIVAFLVFFTLYFADAKAAQNETSSLQFVTEFIRQLGELERVRENAEKNNETGDHIASCIRTSTTFQLTLRAQIDSLSNMHLDGQYRDLTTNILEFDTEYLKNYARMGELCEGVMSGEVSKANLAAAEMPKITATLDYIGKSILQASPLIFSTLIDADHPNKQNQVNRLIISANERKQLIEKIKIQFGSKLESKNQNNIVATVSVIESYLANSDWKNADEP